MNKKELYIPVNVPERNDFFEGFGGRELVITAISLVIGAIGAVLIYLNFNSLLFAFLFLGTVVAVTILLVKRDRIDESFVDKINFVNIYNKQQKRYEYQYYDFYTDIREYETKGRKQGGKSK